MHQLQKLFSPSIIAVIGASANKGKVGNDVLLNVKNTGQAVIYPINPKDDFIEGLKAYKSILDTPKIPDLAIIVVPAIIVPKVVEECGQKGCKNIVIISAGFKESGKEGEKLEEEIKELAKKYKLVILGPNCLGYIATNQSVNASFAATYPKKGNVAFLSQSGALGTAILDMAEAQNFGLSYFVSLGNKAGISELELLDYFAEDKKTKVILMYLESITDGLKFIETAKKITKKKPIIVLKSGKTSEGSRAVSSHTGSLAGMSASYSAAFKQAGIIEAEDLIDFFELAKAFSYQNLPQGDKVAIITNAGGPGIMITDWLIKYGLKLAQLSNKTKNSLFKLLPPASNIHNPVDLLGDALADRYQSALDLIIQDKNVDSIIVALTPQKMTQIKETAEIIGKISRQYNKPIILCFMGEKKIIDNYEIFSKYSLPQFNYPLAAVRALSIMRRQYLWQQEKIIKLNSVKIVKSNKIKQILSKNNLNEEFCRTILIENKFPLHLALAVKNSKEAIKVASKIGYPLAVKVISQQIIHKSDVGGVKVGVNNEKQLLEAISQIEKNVKNKNPKAIIDGYLIGEMVSGLQIIAGMKRDPQFGPLIMVGLGGIYTEIFKDVVFRVVPFNLIEANKMIEELKIYPIIYGSRGQKPLDQKALAELLVKLANFSLAYPEISEIDLNPVIVLEKGRGVKIVDVRMMK